MALKWCHKSKEFYIPFLNGCLRLFRRISPQQQVSFQRLLLHWIIKSHRRAHFKQQYWSMKKCWKTNSSELSPFVAGSVPSTNFQLRFNLSSPLFLFQRGFSTLQPLKNQTLTESAACISNVLTSWQLTLKKQWFCPLSPCNHACTQLDAKACALLQSRRFVLRKNTAYTELLFKFPDRFGSTRFPKCWQKRIDLMQRRHHS
jgi:hypothetical protein